MQRTLSVACFSQSNSAQSFQALLVLGFLRDVVGEINILQQTQSIAMINAIPRWQAGRLRYGISSRKNP